MKNEEWWRKQLLKTEAVFLITEMIIKSKDGAVEESDYVFSVEYLLLPTSYLKQASCLFSDSI